MPRRPRIFIEGGVYHVYNRLVRGDAIFHDPEESRRFIDLLCRIRVRDDLTIFAWCVMSNHYHLAVRTGSVRLARSIGFAQGRFGQDYNRRQTSAGPRWQSRYKAKLVENSQHLKQIIAYIHLNPVAAHLVDDPTEWVLCGHRELLGLTTNPLVDVDQALFLFGPSVSAARKHYVNAIDCWRGLDWTSRLPGELPWWHREIDRPLDPPPPKSWIDERGVSTGRDRPGVDAEEFLVRSAARLNMPIFRIAGRQRDAQTSRVRFLIAGLGIERWGLNPRELAVCLGRRPETVGRWARRAGELRAGDREFRETYESLDQSLSSPESIQ